MNYKSIVLILSLLLHVNAHAWIGKAVHFVGGLVEVVCCIRGVKGLASDTTGNNTAFFLGYAALGGDALLRAASHVSCIGNNTYTKRTLQGMSVLQAAIAIRQIKNGYLPAAGYVFWFFPLGDGVLRLQEAYKSRKQQQDKECTQSTHALTPSS